MRQQRTNHSVRFPSLHFQFLLHFDLSTDELAADVHFPNNCPATSFDKHFYRAIREFQQLQNGRNGAHRVKVFWADFRFLGFFFCH